MGALIKIKSSNYTFYNDGRNVYLKTNGALTQKFVIQTTDFKILDQYGYAELVNAIYRKKINDTESLSSHIRHYRLVPTARTLE